jgi:hypothetical protein
MLHSNKRLALLGTDFPSNVSALLRLGNPTEALEMSSFYLSNNPMTDVTPTRQNYYSEREPNAMAVTPDHAIMRYPIPVETDSLPDPRAGLIRTSGLPTSLQSLHLGDVAPESEVSYLHLK